MTLNEIKAIEQEINIDIITHADKNTYDRQENAIKQICQKYNKDYEKHGDAFFIFFECMNGDNYMLLIYSVNSYLPVYGVQLVRIM